MVRQPLGQLTIRPPKNILSYSYDLHNPHFLSATGTPPLLVPGQSLKFDLELLKCLVVKIGHFEELNERQFDILFDYLVRQRFERAMNNALGFGD